MHPKSPKIQLPLAKIRLKESKPWLARTLFGCKLDSGIGLNGDGLSVMDIWVNVENGNQALEQIQPLLQDFQLEKAATVRIITRKH